MRKFLLKVMETLKNLRLWNPPSPDFKLEPFAHKTITRASQAMTSRGFSKPSRVG